MGKQVIHADGREGVLERENKATCTEERLTTLTHAAGQASHVDKHDLQRGSDEGVDYLEGVGDVVGLAGVGTGKTSGYVPDGCVNNCKGSRL